MDKSFQPPSGNHNISGFRRIELQQQQFPQATSGLQNPQMMAASSVINYTPSAGAAGGKGHDDLNSRLHTSEALDTSLDSSKFHNQSPSHQSSSMHYTGFNNFPRGYGPGMQTMNNNQPNSQRMNEQALGHLGMHGDPGFLQTRGGGFNQTPFNNTNMSSTLSSTTSLHQEYSMAQNTPFAQSNRETIQHQYPMSTYKQLENPFTKPLQIFP